MSCPQELVPAGWRVWRGPVPTELAQLAMNVRDHVLSYPYGSIPQTVTYNGQTVGVFVSHHTWTYRGGQLVTGICIPGCSLIVQQPPDTTGASGQDSLATPDPTAAVYGAEDVTAPAPPASTDWGLVLTGGVVLAAVVGGFLLALRHAGSAAAAHDNPVRCTGPERHHPECRPGRPLCRWRRRAKGICHCDAYPYPHRTGSGACRHGVPDVIRKSPSYRRMTG